MSTDQPADHRLRITVAPDTTAAQARVEQGLHDAAWNAVAVAAVAYRQERARFAGMLALARRHGLTLADLVSATGLDEATVTTILEEAP